MNIKNKFKYILLIFIICFSFVGNVFAADLDLVVGATADKTTVTKGDVVTIMVSIKSSEYINSCIFEQSADSGLELLPTGDDIAVDEQGVYGVGTFGAVGTTTINVMDSGTSGKAPTNGQNILRLKYKVNSSGKITIKTDSCITFTSEKTATHSDVTVNVTAIDKSQDTTLKSLTVTGGTLVNFSPNEKSYSVPLDTSKFSLNMQTSNPEYQDNILVADEEGNILDPSNISFKASNDQGYIMRVFISVNNDTVYDIAFIYENNELDNSLSSLKINGESINLTKGKLNYTYKLASTATEMKVVAVLADSNNFQFDDGSDGVWTYNKSDEMISIVIKPKKNDSGVGSLTYIIEIEKESGSPNNSSSSKPTTGNNGNTTSNPQTGNISMFIMAIILIASLIGSVVLYQKNINNYNN